MPSFRPCVPFYPKLVTQRIALIGACVLSGQATAAGFALNESSAAAAGTAYAGRAAAAQDASALAANPASISSLTNAQWTLGGALILPKGELPDHTATFSPDNGVNNVPVAGGSGRDFVAPVFVPSGYYVRPLDDQWSFGIGIYSPFGLITDYNSDFVGRYLADRSEVTNINIQPTLSYKFTDQLSVGVGFFASFVSGVLTQRAPNRRAPNPFAPEVELKSTVEGDDWQAGLKLGGLWDNGTTSIGVSWTSNVDFKLKGSAKLEGAGVYVKSDGHLELKLPDMLEIGGSHKLTDDWTLVAGALWTGWSSFKEIKVVVDEPFDTKAKGEAISYVPEKWDDVWSFSVGARYQLDPKWLLRFGYAFDESPIKKEYRTARIPDIDRNWLTVGARFTPTAPWAIDMAYGYLIPKTVKVNETAHHGDGSEDRTFTYRGKYKIGAHIAMASLTYQY
ncbi:outer membrane protein transport protein [Parendozoicomonas sp. Alg238-R29]|uniref:OmpP1/FadL family transporter n=1 Tax=Parendozoicomonas sp. Alg238-R29 TaxID=2993446 RepID=UPI00248F2D46|nr:outer membrane protein transport protein [Parendozoicomonas sp. Alg238-R29]